MKLDLDENLLGLLTQTAKQTGMDAYLVGGYVRDQLLGRKSKDIDVLVIGDGIAFAHVFAKKLAQPKDVAYFKTYGTAMVKTTGFEFEFVGARKESYSKESRNPVVTQGTLQDDLERRDFTINAMAISLNEANYLSFLDPFNGRAHLDQGVIKTPLDPGITFDDDPLRMMRAIRFASQLHFDIANETFEAIKEYHERIHIITAERITEELNKIILSREPSYGLNLLMKTGLLKLIFPELHAMAGVQVIQKQSHKDNFYHTLQVLDQGSEETDDLWLRWAILLHDIGKPSCKRFNEADGNWTFHGHEERGSRMVSKIFRRMKLPLNEKMKYVEKLVALHHRPKALAEDGVTDAAIRRLIVDAGDDLDDLFVLCRADMTTKSEAKLRKYRENLEKVRLQVEEVEERDALRNWQPPVTGEDIMYCFAIEPSRQVGQIKEALREAILEGEIRNNRSEAWALMLELGKKIGLNAVHAEMTPAVKAGEDSQV